MKEEWKDIPGYEGLYMVSSEGRIKSLRYRHSNQEHIIPGRDNGDGYFVVQLCKDGRKMFTIHRLVATTFIPNPECKPYIDHINGDRKDNSVSNLRWCTQKENCNYAKAKDNFRKGHTGLLLGEKSVSAKPVIQMSLDGKLIKRYTCIMEASRETGINDSCICRVCKGERKQAGGYRWIYENDCK